MSHATPPSIFEQDLGRAPANHVPLSPLGYLRRAAAIYPGKVAVIHGDRRITYAQFYDRARRFAAALVAAGVRRGDTVAVLAPNIPALLEAHYGVPMAGAVLNALNTRLDAATITFILEHSESSVLIVDREWGETAAAALERLGRAIRVIEIEDPDARHPHSLADGFGAIEYEDFLAGGDPDAVFGTDPTGPAWIEPLDEWDAIALNYTSGTTGNPKGVVYHHRGAYLNALGNAWTLNLRPESAYLWTLPMFHCNGWTYTWGVTAAGGTHVCLRRVEAAAIFDAIASHGVTHMCGAPIVLNMLVNAPAAARAEFARQIAHQAPARPRVSAGTGGAAPPSAVLEAMAALGFDVIHLYGLTECYGPATICAEQIGWADLPQGDRARLKARQGVPLPTMDRADVFADSGQPVPADGATIGEIGLRGNTVMKGYLKNPKATADALGTGWFLTGDLAVKHPDGYIEVKDRSKDIIISGGENISSLEVEEALYRHPAVLEAAVVARPDPKWGESPCAFVTLKPDAMPVDEAAIIAWCRDHLAHFKVPRHVVFQTLPKTSTGKIQKTVLRDLAKADTQGGDQRGA